MAPFSSWVGYHYYLIMIRTKKCCMSIKFQRINVRISFYVNFKKLRPRKNLFACFRNGLEITLLFNGNLIYSILWLVQKSFHANDEGWWWFAEREQILQITFNHYPDISVLCCGIFNEHIKSDRWQRMEQEESYYGNCNLFKIISLRVRSFKIIVKGADKHFISYQKHSICNLSTTYIIG